MAMQNTTQANNFKDKALALFKYLKDLSALKIKTNSNMENYDWKYYLKNIPEDFNNIDIFYCDRLKNDQIDGNSDDTILKVKKPEFEKCPNPQKSIEKWINPGWDSYTTEVSIKEIIIENNIKENFYDNNSRVLDFENWKQKRNDWIIKQQKIRRTRNFFNELYRLHVDLNRNPETIELVVGNGFISLKDSKEINHPILLKRVVTDFDAENNIIRICNSEIDSELYTSFLSNIADVNLSDIKDLQDELKENYYHPLDRNEAYDFLKILIHKISSKSKYLELNEEISKDTEDKLYLKINPVFFKRKRVDGTIKTLEEIITNINENGIIPNHIKDIVNGGKTQNIDDIAYDLPIEELLAETSGESFQILLSKESNKEQLEIAKRIEKYNAVCVQGPPGTGKTHSIANLLGHFLSQGKNVLVTSYSTKALKVLKEKVPIGLQNLCVTVLDDRNTDMERSIDGITEYLSKNTSIDLKRKIADSKAERSAIMENLSKIRKDIYIIKNSEFEPIVYNGESYSPAEVATFVSENADKLSYIPGKVILNKLLPLTHQELKTLYQSNGELNINDEQELMYDIPNPDILHSPTDFSNKVEQLKNYKKDIETIKTNLRINLSFSKNKIILVTDKRKQTLIENPNLCKMNNFLEYTEKLGKIEEWMLYAIVDGNKGSGHRQKWGYLISQIKDTTDYAKSFDLSAGVKRFYVPDEYDSKSVLKILNKLCDEFQKNGKISFFANILNKDFKYILENFKINNEEISSFEDAVLMRKNIILNQKREKVCEQWNYLIGEHNFVKFEDLDKESGEPERVASNYIKIIEKCLNWYSKDLIKLKQDLVDMGLNIDIIFKEDPLDSEFIKTKKIINFITEDLPKYLNISKAFIKIKEIENEFNETKDLLSNKQRRNSDICNKIIKDINQLNVENYSESYILLSKLYNKYNIKDNRVKLLEKLEEYAPDWVAAIKNRDGIHGLNSIPDQIEEAWKWKQFTGIIDKITSQPFEKLQLSNVEQSKNLREKTAQCCEYLAWYHLLKMTESDLDIKQALQGWKMTIKKIGKGTGKNVPKYKREAKKLMTKCQKAVPAWIMPLNKALETLVPGQNLFDVIIVDEASQSDISALTIGYMAKKLIIVGDDKQVSPLAVGTEIEKMNNLMEMHIKNIIPNWQLYEAKTSLYEIAETTFQPLMLKEHFRCVPEIIGYSNKLSYDFKIKPLRDSSSSNLKPATIAYRVDGERDSDKKINIVEAEYITSLILACIENPKYKNSSFGVISLLGKEQSDYIQELLLEKMDNTSYEHHKILCGDASNFQGDERDVIFLSMVDSNNSDGPLSMAGVGANDSRRQRYNVAASRAKNQMWLIHSLDISKDLKSGDMRRDLIEYIQNPNDFLYQVQSIEKKSDSPFEEEICKALVARGYNIVQQWNVGAYKIDMVILYQDKKIALECDGERFHSGDTKIREDMERQTILERSGWTFIRVRGSEYYRDKEKTIKRIIDDLNKNGIYTESINTSNKTKEASQEIEDIKIRAEQIREAWKSKKEEFLELKDVEHKNTSVQISLF